MADQDKLNTEGRKANAAQPLDAAPPSAGAERYPPAAKDDSVEPGESRSFDPNVEAPTPRQGAGDGSAPPSTQEGRTGPEGDPAEGKR